jgi:putative ABC transport system permease protein
MIDWKQEIRPRLASLKLEPTREAEIIEELAQHLDDRYEALLSGGATQEEAYRSALVELSDTQLLALELRRVERPTRTEPVVLGARRKNMIGNLWNDLRYGLRILARSPIFTAVAVLTLTLGIGANTVIFSLVNALLFRPLPAVQEPDQLTYLSGSYSYPDYEYFRDRNEVFSGLLAQGGTTSLNLNTGGEPELVVGELVTANFFSVLGVTPAMGRTFLPEEDRQPGAHPVAVMSYGLWQRRFGSDGDIVGKTISLNGLSFTIVGVMPRVFIGDEVGKQRDLWVPMMMQAQIAPSARSKTAGVLDSRNHIWLNVVGRLKPDVSPEQAQAAMATLQSQIAGLQPGPQPDYHRPMELSRVTGGTDPRERADFLPAAALLLSVVGMVLLTACANVAGLLLARAAARQKEIGIRLALGATRARLVSQLLMESLPLALAAGAAGLLLALWSNGFLSTIELPGGGKVQLDLHLDKRVLGFTLVLSFLTTVLCGLAPALQASRTDVMPTLKVDAPVRGHRRSRLRNFFVVAQVSLSVLLLLGGGLFLRSLESAQRVDPGFAVDRVLLLPINLSLGGYKEEAGRQFYRQVLERMESLPGVHSASLVSRVPLGLDRGRAVVSREGSDPNSVDAEFMTGYNVVSSRYCETMGIALVQGRDFSDSDRKDSRAVAIVNQTLAGRLWPDENPVGNRLLAGGTRGTPVEVIGLTRDGKYESLGERPQPFLYRPLVQDYQSAMTLVAQTEGDPRGLLAAAEGQVRALDRNIAVFPAETMAAYVRASLAPARLGAMLLGIFGLLGLGLAAVGVFSVVAYSVSQRTREIGIRMALGAQPGDVTRLVLKEGMIPVGVGISLGLAAGLALAQLVASLLYGVSATDPITFVSVILLLAAVAFVACYVPARRATKVDPLATLRCE